MPTNESPSKLPSLDSLCISAAWTMARNKITRHEQFVSGGEELGDYFDEKSHKIVKVTIEWVAASEADPKNFEAA